jgi:hypothetical protein
MDGMGFLRDFEGDIFTAMDAIVKQRIAMAFHQDGANLFYQNRNKETNEGCSTGILNRLLRRLKISLISFFFAILRLCGELNSLLEFLFLRVFATLWEPFSTAMNARFSPWTQWGFLCVFETLRD